MWDRRSSLLKSTAHLLTGIRDRVGANEEHMRVTLERLKARAEQRRLSLLTGLFVDEVDADADGLRPTSGEHVAEQSSAGCEVRLPWPAHGQCAHHAVLARQQ